MRTFLDLNGYDIVRDYTDEAAEDDLVSLIFDLAANVVSEQQFEAWLRPRIVIVSESP